MLCLDNMIWTDNLNELRVTWAGWWPRLLQCHLRALACSFPGTFSPPQASPMLLPNVMFLPHWHRFPCPPHHRFCNRQSAPASPGCQCDTAPPPTRKYTGFCGGSCQGWKKLHSTREHQAAEILMLYDLLILLNLETKCYGWKIIMWIKKEIPVQSRFKLYRNCSVRHAKLWEI